MTQHKQNRRLIILAALALPIIGYAIKLVAVDFRHNWQTAATLTGEPLFPKMDVNSIHAVIIRDKKDTAKLKRTGKQWIVEREQGYPADFTRLRELIRQCQDTLIIDTRPIIPADLEKLELLDPKDTKEGVGTSVELFGENGQLIAKLLLGKLHAAQADGRFHDGRYVLIPGQGSALIVREFFTSAVTDDKLWTDSTFPRVKMARRIARRKGKELIWELTREKPNTLLACTFPENAVGSEYRSEYSSQMEHALAYAKYVNVHRESERNDWGFSEEMFEFEDFEGFVYSFELGKATEGDRLPIRLTVRRGENFNATPANVERFDYEALLFEDWVYLLAKATYGPMGTTLEQLFPDGIQSAPEDTDVNFQETNPDEDQFQE